MSYSLAEVKVKINDLELQVPSNEFQVKKANLLVNWILNADTSIFENNLDDFIKQVLSMVEPKFKDKVVTAWFTREAGSNITIECITEKLLNEVPNRDSDFWGFWLDTKAGISFKKNVNLKKLQDLAKTTNLEKSDLAELTASSFQVLENGFSNVETLKEILKLFENEVYKKKIITAWFRVFPNQPMKYEDFKLLQNIDFCADRLIAYLGTGAGQDVPCSDIIDNLAKVFEDNNYFRKIGTKANLTLEWFKTHSGKKATFADLKLILTKQKVDSTAVVEAWLYMQKDWDVKKEVNLIDVDDYMIANQPSVTVENLIELLNRFNSYRSQDSELFRVFAKLRFAKLFNLEQLQKVCGKHSGYSDDVPRIQDSFIKEWVKEKALEVSVEEIEGLSNYVSTKVKEELCEIYRKKTNKDILLDKKHDNLVVTSVFASASIIPVAMLAASIVCTFVFPPALLPLVILGIVGLGLITFVSVVFSIMQVGSELSDFTELKAVHKALDLEYAKESVAPKTGVGSPNAVSDQATKTLS